MAPLELMASLQARGFTLTPKGGILGVKPSENLTDIDRVAIRAHKSEILALLEMPKPRTIWQIADLELTPIIPNLTEPAYLYLEWGGVLCLMHKISPATSQTDHIEQARAKLERKYAGKVPPINTITLEQQSNTLGRVSVALERVPPICKACVFWKSFNGTSRACSKKNLETHPLYFCDVAGPNTTGLAFKEVTS
jgi:hypothetical protein